MTKTNDPLASEGEIPQKSLQQAAARGITATLMAQGCRFVLQFASIPILARLLSPSDFGLVAMVLAIIGVAEILRDFGLSTAAIQSRTLSNNEKTNLFWANSAIGFACACLVCALSPIVSLIYDDARLTGVTLALSAVFVLNGMAAQFIADINREMRFWLLSAVDLVPQLVALSVALLFAFGGAGFWALVAQQLAVASIALILAVCLSRFWPGLPDRGTSISKFFRFGGSLVGTRFMSYAAQNVDNIALGVAFGPVQLGFYSRAYQLLMLPLQQIAVPTSRVAIPVLSRIQDYDARFQAAVRKAQLVGLYLTAPLFAFLAGLSGPIVSIVFGSGWHPVADIFAILAIGGIFRVLVQISYWIFVSRGRTFSQFVLYAWTQPLICGALVVGCFWGTIGVSVAHSASYFAFWIVAMLFAGRAATIPVRNLFGDAIICLLLIALPVGIIAAASAHFVDQAAFAIFVGVLTCVVYVALIALVSRRARTDLSTILQFVRQAAGRKGIKVGK
ncbi:MAG: lipopolysaccharide biosynthesis protein [Gordonia sp. (in: high G+C Gram-positive bacteria)]|nr:MAG: lipopolysaccharide biosynthesis protein [Gordonia sp. (in: high G+C Gram-positive bacteria)]